MKNISIKEIDKKLSSFNSITEKLEYWVKNKEYVEDKYLSKMQYSMKKLRTPDPKKTTRTYRIGN